MKKRGARKAASRPAQRSLTKGRLRSSNTAKPIGSSVETEGLPRYLEVANNLMAAIEAGRYPIGSILPTELELCKSFSIGRFTAREAMRQLSDAGLVVRKQRVGTQVVASGIGQKYTQSLSSIEDLLQYARNTELRLLFTNSIAVDAIQASELHCERGTSWVLAIGIRYEHGNGRPVCMNRVYLNPLLEGIADRLRERTGTIYELVEQSYGVSITRIDQRISAVSLSRDDSLHLGAMPGMPALRVLRHYYDAQNRLLQMSDNIHPADRFVYSLSLAKANAHGTVTRLSGPPIVSAA